MYIKKRELTCGGSWQEIPTIHFSRRQAILFYLAVELVIRTLVEVRNVIYAFVEHVAEGFVRVSAISFWTLKISSASVCNATWISFLRSSSWKKVLADNSWNECWKDSNRAPRNGGVYWTFLSIANDCSASNMILGESKPRRSLGDSWL